MSATSLRVKPVICKAATVFKHAPLFVVNYTVYVHKAYQTDTLLGPQRT